jgi:tRNA(Arg) A34 adenosine deaminase TadA
MVNNTLVAEVIGYLASAGMVVTFFFKNIKRIRLIGAVACTLFVAYGLLIAAYPLVAANLIIVAINLTYLLRRGSRAGSDGAAGGEPQLAFLRQAIRLAAQNVDEQGGGPFGAVVVKDGQVVAAAANHVTTANDPTAHAEVNAIREACRRLGTFDLSGCDIYASCEPCPMCLAAIYWARISRIYYAGNRHDAELAGFDDSFIYDELGKPREQRKVPLVALLRSEGKAPLEQWRKAAGKVRY